MNPEYELDSPVSKGAFKAARRPPPWSSKLKPDHYERLGHRLCSAVNGSPSASPSRVCRKAVFVG